MARGGFPGMGGMGGGGNMQQMMKQVQKLQQQAQKTQEELEQREFEATSGGGMVKVRASGKKELLSLEINPQAVDPEDVEMLQDLVLAAVNEVLRNIEDTTNAEMQKLGGGRGLGF
jgi:DNA-binding YbaB/EbfC family protein